MRRLLNTMYVMTAGAYLSKDGTNIVVTVEGEESGRIPIHNIENIVTFGSIGCSPYLMRLCAESGVGLTFMTRTGRFMCRVSGPVTGNVLLRRAQYRLADDEKTSLNLARSMILGKFANCRNVVRRGRSDHGGKIDVSPLLECESQIASRMTDVKSCHDFNSLRGIEGDVARKYFGCMDSLILHQKDSFYMDQRTRRPPMDNVNALLSYLYTILANDVASSLESVGLDPYVGFLHRDRPGRPSLALDLMEEMRPFMVDRLVLTMINMNMVNSAGFVRSEGGGVIMNEITRKRVVDAWQKRKWREITHPYLREKIPIGLIPFIQSMLLARYIRGDIDGYPPFFSN